MRYYYTTETEYFEAEVSNKKLTYIHIDEQRKGDKCSEWVASVPCWSDEDLVTDRITLTESEINDLVDFVEEADFDSLDSYYGPEQSRCHTREIEVTTDAMSKSIIFCRSDDGPKEPLAFTKLREKLEAIIIDKFNE